MDSRQEQLRAWAIERIGPGEGAPRWSAVSEDASTRRYYRLELRGRVGLRGRPELRGHPERDGHIERDSHSWVAVDAPPATEKNQSFVAVQGLLASNGIRVPALLHIDSELGFMLQEDLGDRLLLDALDDESVDGWYAQALELLGQLQRVRDPEGLLPDYDRETLGEEYSRFARWFCEGLLQLTLDSADRAIIEETGAALIDSALQQPAVFVHRDFHSRNLMIVPTGELAALDFQDALRGPLCYDLVSLLRDCYIRWPPERVRNWALQYRDRLLAAGQEAGASEAEFLRWFDWMGLQRHLKVLGNFSRLSLRDDKSHYLEDIPLVLEYCLEVLDKHDELGDLAEFFRREVQPRVEGALRDERQRVAVAAGGGGTTRRGAGSVAGSVADSVANSVTKGNRRS